MKPAPLLWALCDYPPDLWQCWGSLPALSQHSAHSLWWWWCSGSPRCGRGTARWRHNQLESCWSQPPSCRWSWGDGGDPLPPEAGSSWGPEKWEHLVLWPCKGLKHGSYKLSAQCYNHVKGLEHGSFKLSTPKFTNFEALFPPFFPTFKIKRFTTFMPFASMDFCSLNNSLITILPPPPPPPVTLFKATCLTLSWWVR